jgi:hypothetical protein
MSRTTRVQYFAAWLCGAGLVVIALAYRGVLQEPEHENVAQSAASNPAPREDDTHSPSAERPSRAAPWAGPLPMVAGIVMTAAGLFLWFRQTQGRRQWVRANEDA